MDAALDHPPAAAAGWAYFLDFDGTLVGIVATPDAVVVETELLELLSDLDRATGGAVAVISGRPVAEIDAFLNPLRLPAAGLHGLERRLARGGAVERTGPAGDRLDDLRRRAAAFAGDHPGVLVEDKGATLALHYRGAPATEPVARALMAEGVAALGDDYTLLEGKMVSEVKPRAASKGMVVEAFMATPPFAGRHPVFVGDDVTDEAGFLVCNAHGGTTVRVGQAPYETQARYMVDDVAAARAWLARLGAAAEKEPPT